MNILIVYYSLEGATRTIAEEMSKESGGDLLEIHPVKEFPNQSGWKYVVGGFYSTMKRPSIMLPRTETRTEKNKL